jgi:hypothetical protein
VVITTGIGHVIGYIFELMSFPVGAIPSPRHSSQLSRTMSASDHDILRRAKLMIGQHDAAAVEKARERVADLQAKGDRESADVWLQIIVAIETLRQPGPTQLF